MSNDANQDLFTSHAVINYMMATAQGAYAYHTALARLKSPDFKEEKLQDEKKRIEKILDWRTDLLRGECLFSATWEEAKTFEASSALKVAEDLRLELLEQIQTLVRILNQPINELSMDDAKQLCASLARFFYSKEHYMRGFVDLGKAHVLEELVAQYMPVLETSTAELKIAHDLIKAVGDSSTLAIDLAGALRYQNLRMPGVFAGQAHEINQLVWRYRGGFTYEALGVDLEALKRWAELSIPPQIAGYWIGYGISADEALAWNQIGLGNHEVAAAWRLHGFSPDTAPQWIAHNFSPPVALQWASTGLNAEQALEKIAEQQKIARITQEQSQKIKQDQEDS